MIARVKRFWGAIGSNPVLQLELRGVRRRLGRFGRLLLPAYLVLLFLLLLLGGALGAVLATALESEMTDPFPVWSIGAMAAICPANAIGALLEFLLPWIVPAIAALSIVQERETGTWEVLRSTALTARDVALGKLGGCLGRLWPALLALALLAPFRLLWTAATTTLTATGGLPATAMPYGGPLVPSLLSSIPASLVTQLRPWTHILLHTALGLLASALSRSSTTALALAYGGAIVGRTMLWLVSSVLTLIATFLLVDFAASAPQTGLAGGTTSLLLVAEPLAMVGLEGLLAAGLIGIAIRRLEWA
jgi:hypothetical protein